MKLLIVEGEVYARWADENIFVPKKGNNANTTTVLHESLNLFMT